MPRVRRTGRRQLGRAAIALAAAAAATTLTASSAQASWTPISTMTASRYEGEAPAAVAVDRYGDTLLAWAAFNENLVNGYPCYHQIQVRVRTRAGRLGPIETLTPGCQEMDWPVAAIDDNGAGIVAWIRNSDDAVLARRVSAAGKLGPLLTLTPKGVGTATVSVAISPSGQAVAAWIQVGGGSSVQARYIGMNNVLGPVRTIGSAQPDTPGLVIGRNGVATVTWSDGSFQRPVARRLTLNAVGPLTVIMPAAASTTYSVPQIADDANGDTIFLMRRIGHTATAQPTYLHVREWYRGGKLGATRELATRVQDWRLATDGVGDSLAVWTQYVNSTQQAVFARRVSRTGSLGTGAKLGLGYVPAITVDPAGRGLVAWQSTPANTQGLTKQYAREFNVSTGKYTGQFTLTPDGNLVRLSESWSGRYAAIWQRSTSPWPIQARFGP